MFNLNEYTQANRPAFVYSFSFCQTTFKFFAPDLIGEFMNEMKSTDGTGPAAMLLHPTSYKKEKLKPPSMASQNPMNRSISSVNSLVTSTQLSLKVENPSNPSSLTTSQAPIDFTESSESGVWNPGSLRTKKKINKSPCKKLIKIEFPNFIIEFNHLSKVPHLLKDRDFAQRAEKQYKAGLSACLLIAPVKKEKYLEQNTFECQSDNQFIAKPQPEIETVYVVHKSPKAESYRYVGTIVYKTDSENKEEMVKRIADPVLNSFLAANDRNLAKHDQDENQGTAKKELFIKSCQDTGLYFFGKTLANPAAETPYLLEDAFEYLSRFSQRMTIFRDQASNKPNEKAAQQNKAFLLSLDENRVNYALGCCYLNRARVETKEQDGKAFFLDETTQDEKALEYFAKNKEDFKSTFELACLKYKLNPTQNPKSKKSHPSLKIFKKALKMSYTLVKGDYADFIGTFFYLMKSKNTYHKLFKFAEHSETPSPWSVTLLLHVLNPEKEKKKYSLLQNDKYTVPLKGYLPAMLLNRVVDFAEAERLYQHALVYKHQYTIQRDYRPLVKNLFSSESMKNILQLKSNTGYDLELIRQLSEMRANIQAQHEENQRVPKKNVLKKIDFTNFYRGAKINPFDFNLYQYDPLSGRTFLDLFNSAHERGDAYQLIVSFDCYGKIAFFDASRFTLNMIEEKELVHPAIFEWNLLKDKFEFLRMC